MRKFILVAALLALGACSAQTVATTEADVQAACLIDGILQPITAATVAALIPGGAAAVAADNTTIHPAIQAYCAASGAIAVAMTKATVVAPVVPAPVVAPAVPATK